MGSLHSFDRALDKFMAWLSDAESSLESLELELESYGPGVKTSRERVLMQLKVGHRALDTLLARWRRLRSASDVGPCDWGARNNRTLSVQDQALSRVHHRQLLPALASNSGGKERRMRVT